MEDRYYLTIAYGLKAIFRDGNIIAKINDSKKEINDEEIYIDKIVVVPNDISKEEAEALIKEKKAYPYNYYVEIDKLKDKFRKENKDIYDNNKKDEFSKDFSRAIKKLVKQIRIIDDNAFIEKIRHNKKVLKNYYGKNIKKKKIKLIERL